MDDKTRKALSCVALFYDQRKVGDVGFLGFRRSSDLSRLVSCIHTLRSLSRRFHGRVLT
ncbi:MAG: hypothetical protein ABIL06_12735 [Pseudomonadota bacterium]